MTHFLATEASLPGKTLTTWLNRYCLLLYYYLAVDDMRLQVLVLDHMVAFRTYCKTRGINLA